VAENPGAEFSILDPQILGESAPGKILLRQTATIGRTIQDSHVVYFLPILIDQSGAENNVQPRVVPTKVFSVLCGVVRGRLTSAGLAAQNKKTSISIIKNWGWPVLWQCGQTER
jgi:hypothetical protein